AGTIDMVINVPSGRQERADGYEIRAAATANSVPLITTLAEFAAAVTSLEGVRDSTFDVRSLQDWSAGCSAPGWPRPWPSTDRWPGAPARTRTSRAAGG